METIKNKDIRLSNVEYEVRSVDGDEKSEKITGYALKFDRPSEDLGFIEYIDKRALDKANMDNVVALLNHDSNYVLGRVGRNLTLSVDDVGLYFEIEPTGTSYSRDLLENMRSGLIDKCSFAFTIPEGGDQWKKLATGGYQRTINSIDKLYDVSVVTTPAYSDTEAVLSERSLESKREFIDGDEKTENESRSREVEVMEIELEL